MYYLSFTGTCQAHPGEYQPVIYVQVALKFSNYSQNHAAASGAVSIQGASVAQPVEMPVLSRPPEGERNAE